MVGLNGEVYFFGGFYGNKDVVSSVEIYSPSTDSWSRVVEMNDRCINFSACSFLDNVYVNGGLVQGVGTDSCLEFKIKTSKWTEKARMLKVRSSSACAVLS